MTRWLAESSALFTAVEFHVAVNAGREPLVFRCAWVRSADKNEEAWDTSEDESAEVALWSGLDGCSKEHFPNFAAICGEELWNRELNQPDVFFGDQVLNLGYRPTVKG